MIFAMMLSAALMSGNFPRSETNLARPLAELGVTSSTCAAAGLTLGDVNALFGRVESSGAAGLKITSAALDAALARLARAETDLLTSPGDDAVLAELESARAEFVQANSALQEARDSVWSAAVQGLSSAQRSGLANARASRTFRLCAHYRVADLNSKQRGLLSTVGGCDHIAAQLPAKVVELAAEVEGRADVITAKQKLAANLEDVRQAFANYAGGQ